jgi:hypothetical protein
MRSVQPSHQGRYRACRHCRLLSANLPLGAMEKALDSAERALVKPLSFAPSNRASWKAGRFATRFGLAYRQCRIRSTI